MKYTRPTVRVIVDPIPDAIAAPSMPIPRGPMNRMSRTMFARPLAMDPISDMSGLPAVIRNCVTRYWRIMMGPNTIIVRRYVSA